MENKAEELRNAFGKLVAKYYQSNGVIEIVQKGCCSKIIFPPGTSIRFEPGNKHNNHY